jgi:activator of HSP90 ATPase
MKDIKQYHFINALAEEVFNAITNRFAIELWSGYPAQMEPVENTEFSIFDGDITGINLQVVQNKKLVQQWYFGELEPPSLVTIELKENKKGTKVSLLHTNVPDEDFENIEQGWTIYYWGAIKEFFK